MAFRNPIHSLPASAITGQIGSGQIADGAVIVGKLGPSAVELANIADAAVNAQKIADEAVTSGKLAALAVGSAHLADLAVNAAKIAANAVTVTAIADNAVNKAKIATNAVGDVELIAGSVIAGKIAAGGVVAGNIAANTVTATELAAGSVIAGKIAAGTVTATELAAGSVTTGKIVAANVTSAELAAGSVIAGKIAANAVTAGTIAASAVTAGTIAANAVTAASIAATAIDGKTITGSTVQTAASANRVVVNTGTGSGGGTIGRVQFFTEIGTDSAGSVIAAGPVDGSTRSIVVTAPKSSLNPNPAAALTLSYDPDASTPTATLPDVFANSLHTSGRVTADSAVITDLSATGTFTAVADRITSIATAATGWTVTASEVRACGPMVMLRVTATRTGTTITSDSAGNITDSTVCTIPTVWAPDVTVVGTYDRGGIADGNVSINTDGTVVLKSLSPTATIPASTGTVQFTVSWVTVF